MRVVRPGGYWFRMLLPPLFLIALALWVYAPLAPFSRFGRALIPGDACEFALLLAWGRHALLHGPWATIFTPPIAYPLPAAGGLTDVLPGLAALSLPLQAFTANPVALYNLTRILLGAFNAIAIYALCREAGAGKAPALAGAVIAAYCGPALVHARGHFSAHSFGWTALALLFALRALRLARMFHGQGMARETSGSGTATCGASCVPEHVTRCRGDTANVAAPFAPAERAHHGPEGAYFTRECEICGLSAPSAIAASGLCLLAQAACSSRLGLMGLFALLATPGLYRRPAEPRACLCRAGLLTAWLVAALLAAFLYRPASAIRAWIEPTRSICDAVPHSLDLLGLFLPATGLDHIRATRPAYGAFVSIENTAFFGWAPFAVLVVWLALVLVRRSPAKPAAPWWCGAGALLLLALGPRLVVGGVVHNIPTPWAALLHAVPALEAMRTVGRFALMAGLYLAVASALSLDAISATLRLRGLAALAPSAACLAATLALCAGHRTPPGLLDIDPAHPLHAAIAHLPAGAGVVQLPFMADPTALLRLVPRFPVTPTSIAGGMRNPSFLFARDLLLPVNAASLDYLRTIGISHIVSTNDHVHAALATCADITRIDAATWRLDSVVPASSPAQAFARLPATAREVALAVRMPDEAWSDAAVLRPGSPGAEWGVSPPLRACPTDEGLLCCTPGPHGYVQVLFPQPIRASTVEFLVRFEALPAHTVQTRLHWRGPEGWYDDAQSLAAHVRVRPDGDQVLHFDMPATAAPDGILALRLDPDQPLFPGVRYQVRALRLNAPAP